MGRSVFCDESLIKLLENISNNDGFTPGLIIGQFSDLKDYVIHLPQTPFPSLEEGGSSGDAGNQVKNVVKIEDIDDKQLANHARTVTRMLSGGMWVLGFYIVGKGNIFDDRNALIKLKNIANAIHNCTKGNDYLCGKDPSSQKLIFHFNSQSKKFVCKTVDTSSLNSSIQPADWKFKPNITSWLKLESSINMSWLPPFTFSNDLKGPKKKFMECLRQFDEYLNKQICTINGIKCSLETILIGLKSATVKKADKNDKDDENHFQLMFFSDNLPDEKEEPRGPSMHFFGVLHSIVFLHDKATAEDAHKAVRLDLLRSFASRLEMHWQTFEEPINEKCNYIIRQPPRRVLFTPEKSPVSYSEYIFEGEVEEDALPVFSENLGFSEGSIRAFEGLWKMSTPKEKEEEALLEGITRKSTSPNSSTLLLGIIAAGITLILSIAIHFLYS